MMSVDNVIAKKYPPILAMSSLSVSLCHTIPPCAALGIPYDHCILVLQAPKNGRWEKWVFWHYKCPHILPWSKVEDIKTQPQF